MSEQKLSRRKSAALRQADNDLKATLAVPAGRRVLMRLIDGAGVFARSYTGNNDTFYREGRRAIGLELVEHIEQVQPGAFAALQQEAHALRLQLESINEAGETDET